MPVSLVLQPYILSSWVHWKCWDLLDLFIKYIEK